MRETFFPLACHSFFSLLWGTASVEDLCRRAKESGVTGLALTDREGLYGALPFWEAAREAGLKPILGAEIPGTGGGPEPAANREPRQASRRGPFRGAAKNASARCAARGDSGGTSIQGPVHDGADVARRAIGRGRNDRSWPTHSAVRQAANTHKNSLTGGPSPGDLQTSSHGGPFPDSVRLLAADSRGYRRLSRLLTLCHQEKARSRGFVANHGATEEQDRWPPCGKGGDGEEIGTFCRDRSGAPAFRPGNTDTSTRAFPPLYGRDPDPLRFGPQGLGGHHHGRRFSGSHPDPSAFHGEGPSGKEDRTQKGKNRHFRFECPNSKAASGNLGPGQNGEAALGPANPAKGGVSRKDREAFRRGEERQTTFPFIETLLEALIEDRRGLVVLASSAPILERLARETGTSGLYVALPPFGPQRELIRLSRRTGIPLAAVAPVTFLDPGDYPLHRMLRAIGLSTKLDRVPARELAPPWAWFRRPGQWVERYLHCPEALAGMREAAERCALDTPPWGEWVFPPFEGLSAEATFATLERKAREGARRRYGDLGEALLQRLTYELGIIRSKSLASYFLVVEDIVRQFPITCGRGSAAASLVSYALGITHVDPMRHNLFFERFLNLGRTDPPDIDVDFPWDERDAVLSYVLEKYGPEHCAMVANHVSFGSRAALREIAKVYGVPAEEIERVSRGLSRLGDLYRPGTGEESPVSLEIEPSPSAGRTLTPKTGGESGQRPGKTPRTHGAPHRGASSNAGGRPSGERALQGYPAGNGGAPQDSDVHTPAKKAGAHKQAGSVPEASVPSREGTGRESRHLAPSNWIPGPGAQSCRPPGTARVPTRRDSALDPAAARRAPPAVGLAEARTSVPDYIGAAPPASGHAALRRLLLQPPWPQVLYWTSRLQGVPRHLSVHCGGVVITPDALPERVPVEQAHKGVPVIQWEKDGAEAAGLVKIDLLGNRSLAVIRDTLAAIRAHGGRHLSYDRFDPLEDSKTKEMLGRGDTVGVFYVESPAMRQLLKKTGKGDYEHLVVQSSIIRPAANEFIREYVRRVRGGIFAYLHPLLEEILRETHGILCYQEDVSRVAMALAGFDAVQADLLRKVLSKKHRHARLADFRERFRAGALARGVPPRVVEEVWRMILSFQGYSFCKPHSASYALVSFKSCYLKAHHPAEFMAAVISNQGGFYTTMAYLSEARRMGLEILPPDVNESAYAYTGRNHFLRVGLMQLQGARRASIEALLAERGRRGHFRSFAELLERVDADPSDFRILIKAGCLDSISGNRPHPELFWELLAWEAGREAKTGARRSRGERSRETDLRVRPREGTRGKPTGLREAGRAYQEPEKGEDWTKTGIREKVNGSGFRHGGLPARPDEGQSRGTDLGCGSFEERDSSLFPEELRFQREDTRTDSDYPGFSDFRLDTTKGSGFVPPRGRPYSLQVRLRHEMETLGLLVSRPPLEWFRPWLERLDLVPAAELAAHVGRRVTLAGWFVTAKTVLSRRDEPMEFASFEDGTALYETTFFPEAYRRFSHLVGHSRPYLLRGRVEEDFGAVSVTVEEVAFLDRIIPAGRRNPLPPRHRRPADPMIDAHASRQLLHPDPDLHIPPGNRTGTQPQKLKT